MLVASKYSSTHRSMTADVFSTFSNWPTTWPTGLKATSTVSSGYLCVAATNKYPNESVDVAFNPVGQVVGQFTKVERSAAVIERWVTEYLEATTRLNDLNEAAASV